MSSAGLLRIIEAHLYALLLVVFWGLIRTSSVNTQDMWGYTHFRPLTQTHNAHTYTHTHTQKEPTPAPLRKRSQEPADDDDEQVRARFC